MRRRRTVVALWVAALGLAALAGAGALGGYRLNMTPSVALGVWRIEALQRPVRDGDLVFICPPPGEMFRQALRRGYLRPGLCPGGLAPLIKRVAALPGHLVEIGTDVFVDGRRLAGSRIRGSDSQDRAMHAWSGGPVPPGTLFVHSTFEGSYDSRYFGPIPDEGLLGTAKPVFAYFP